MSTWTTREEVIHQAVTLPLSVGVGSFIRPIWGPNERSTTMRPPCERREPRFPPS